jgi:hypothetical protein
MFRIKVLSVLAGLVLITQMGTFSLAATKVPTAPTELDLGKVQKLTVNTAHQRVEGDGSKLILSGADARLQLIISAEFKTKKGAVTRDYSRNVTYTTAPAGILKVSTSGLVTPVKTGKASVIAKTNDGSSVSVEISAVAVEATPDIHFTNRIVPIFTKLGCNGGGCHGKSGGQNGFRLSLLGFEPLMDYEFLVKEGRGRRLFPSSPDQSLLLTKASNTIPHGGGEKLKKDSFDYDVIRRWIGQGMPPGDREAPHVTRIEVHPYHQIMRPNGKQQVSVVAVYSDGSTEDVTNTAQYEPNNKDMAECDETGLVQVFDQTGDVAFMVRYQSQVGVFRATIPLGAPVGELPKANNFVDELVFKKLKVLGMPPSKICDDGTFIRRVSIDVAGKLPTRERVDAFLADKSADKRSKYIDELLASTDYADFFAMKWSSILRNKRRDATYVHGTFRFHSWIRQNMHQNTPYDEFVRGVIAASGDMRHNPPVAWHREVTKPEEALEDVAQLFLGIRLQCAKCHHHPYEKWSQDDYYGFAAFFSRVGRKNGATAKEKRVFHNRGTAAAKNPKSGNTLKPTGLGDKAFELAADDDPRHSLADWMSNKKNPFFAKSLVNRYWKHFFNRGLVDPEDDMRATNPATNPELLEALAKSFKDSDFDLKKLVKTICESRTYQLSAYPNEYNANDRQNFSRYYPRRLPAEVLLDAIDNFCGTTTSFSGLPTGTRAVQIPDRGGVTSYFLTVFGAPEGSSVCECERTSDANLAQCLHLLNSREVQDKLAKGRAAKMARDKSRSHEDRITELYALAFSRKPDDFELKTSISVITKYGEKQVQLAYEDIVWALINTKEFMFNH